MYIHFILGYHPDNISAVMIFKTHFEISSRIEHRIEWVGDLA